MLELAAEFSCEGGFEGGADGAVAEKLDSVRSGVGRRILAALLRRRLKLPLRPTNVATLVLSSST